MDIEIEVKELLKYFLYKSNVDKMESKNGQIKIYRVGDDLVRVDIKQYKPKPMEEAWRIEKARKSINRAYSHNAFSRILDLVFKL